MNKYTSPFFYIGTLLLLVATGSSLVLSGTKLGLFNSIPGCGVGSGCDNITNGPWGTVPGVLIPVSFVGLAWFWSLFVAWTTGTNFSNKFKSSVLLGVFASLGFIVVMVFIGSFCKWCALSHFCNILFWVLCVRGKKNEGSSLFEPVVLWGSFVVSLCILFIVGTYVSKNKTEHESLKYKENLEQITAGGAEESTLALLKGGHRIGSPSAPVQIVMYTDYQCPDCKRIEGDLAQLMTTRDDISVVVKHFPLNYDCNDTIGTFKLHGNACWAARAAEAAAMIGGEEAWEKMHTWLFSQGGSFTDQSFAGSLTALGFNAQDVIATMMDDKTLALVKGDAVDGKALGVYFTPMVFINGVEYLWYYGGQGTIEQAINKVVGGVGAGVVEAPPGANKKLVEDWRRGRKTTMPGEEGLVWFGDGEIEFVVWGDYQASLSKELDREIKNTIKRFPNTIKYTFRHFPIDENCNAGISSMLTKYDGSCVLAKLVIAAHALGGEEARKKMHNWLMEQVGTTNIEDAKNYALSITGVSLDILQDVMVGIDVNNQMRVDILTKNNVWRKGVPVLTIDHRFVPRWKSDEIPAQEMFKQIIQLVGGESEK
ncbi:MAG: thioredoxin domain-containing protein [Phycisphaerae bacterium]|jgi:protein-disulfide isomerase/uncharacterized membrane protein|nr:thioredoxin domain-containing protein [Phycisphaerae bacterium]MBT6282192.1 thioredoxin domain-containing protein [Phycisphaerae bacterium]